MRTSSVVDRIDYDAPTKTLEVQFRSGRVYQYANVPRAVYREFASAPSIGSYFNHEIRDRYPAREIKRSA